MSGITPLALWIADKLKNAPTLANAEQRVALAKEIEAQSEKTIAQLRAEIVELKHELELRIPLEFTEHRGVLWKRLPSGGFADEAYCPTHRLAMSRFAGELVCTANKCGYQAPFDNRQLAAAHASIPSDA
jgi:hypothetical protein